MALELDRADRELRQALKRLAASDTRMKRRNARLALFGVLRSIKHGVNEEYPAIAKPKPAPPEKTVKVHDIYKELRPNLPPVKMPFRRGWRLPTAELFAGLVLSHYGANAEVHKFYPGGAWDVLAWKLAKITLGHMHNKTLCRSDADYGQFHARALEIVELYRQFWTGEIFVADLQLAAEHQRWFEQRKGKK